MNRFLPLAAGGVLLLASCTDRTTSLDPSTEIPPDLLRPSLSVLDGKSGGNGHFFWLPPLGESRKGFDGVADGSFHPVVEICPRNAAGDGCTTGPALARLTRDDGEDKHRIKVDDRNEYFVHWHMADFTPARDGVYRIRVLLGESEVGHADVIALRQHDIKAYASQGGDLVPVSDKGSFKIAFRMEEGVLQDQFCQGDCAAVQEMAGDGEPAIVQVTGTTSQGEAVAAVVTAPDAVFTDVGGTPISGVVVTAEVKVAPPSNDVFTDDDQEIPFFVEINTYPEDVYIDPDGPGVTVVVCQDEDALNARGIGSVLHPQMILYKVSDSGTTLRLTSTFGAPECAGAAPAPEQASKLLGVLRRGTSRVLGVLGPQPLVARRRLHGGLNTVITRDASLDAAFSTFGAALGPNADSSFAVLPANGDVGVPLPVTIQLRNALGENFVLGGDSLEVTVRGANPTPVFLATDGDNGLHAAAYTPATTGVDSIDVVLIRADGVGLGPIGGSPYVIPIFGPTLVSNADDAGPGSLRQAILEANAQPGLDTVTFAIPGGGPQTIPLASPLPAITEAVVIDASTQPGYDGLPYVEVDGSGVAGFGLDVQASQVTIRGLAVTGFAADGIFVLQGTTGALIEDNTVGTDRAGSGGKGNQNAGIRYRGASGTIRDNLISGNLQSGILVEGATATGNTIRDNVIGLDPAGTSPLPNGWNGITMFDGADNNIIRDNVISGNDQRGIDIQHSGPLAPVTGTQILANVVGLDVNGDVVRKGITDLLDGPTNYGPVDRGNLLGGMRLVNAPGTVVGLPGQGNVISGNRGHGIRVEGNAAGTTVRGNLVGVDATGTSERGNGSTGDDGISVESAGASGVVIGGTGAGEGNVVSGNFSDGIRVPGATSNVTVQGNLIGTDVTGTYAIGNGRVGSIAPCCHSGMQVDNGGGIVIGGAAPGAGNVVSGNNTGLWIGSAPGVQIVGNKIGTDVSGSGFVPNVGDGGIALYGTVNAVVQDNVVSGNTALAGIFMASGPANNLIQFNTFQGNTNAAVVLHPSGGSGNTFRSNAMSGNGFGIDLGWDGPTANDALDADAGPNDLTNRPEQLGALNGVLGGQTRVQVTLNAAPSTVYQVEYFSSPACHGSGYGEGAVPLSLVTAPATDAAGQVTFAVGVPAVTTGQAITATATDPAGSTSELSACATVGDAGAVDQQNLLDGSLGGQGIGRFSDINGSPDPSGTSFDHQDAQTFTVGVTGQLTAVRLPVRNLSGATVGVTVEVTQVTGGVPNDALSLGSVTLPASLFVGVVNGDPSTWPVFDLRTLGINVTAGEVLAYQVRTMSPSAYIYNPEFSNLYPGGTGYRRNFAVTATWSTGGQDFGFQAFVKP